MWDQLNKISTWIDGVVSRVDYYLKVVKWFFNALKTVSDILNTFPRPAADETTKSKNNSDERSGAIPESNGDGTTKQ